jgi:hypothetical protein
MQKVLMLVTFMWLSFNAAVGQSVTKVFAYYYIQNTGTVPNRLPRDNAEGNATQEITQSRGKQYLIYLSSATTKKPRIISVRIKNNTYRKIRLTPLADTDVVYDYNDGMQNLKKTIVPKGTRNIFIVDLGLPTPDTKLIPRKNENEIIYLLGRRRVTQKFELTELPSSLAM